MGQQIQTAGFYLSGFLCLVLAVLKLTIEGHWSWWRVLLPLGVVLGHNALYITVGFVWLIFTDDGAAGEEATIRQGDRPYGYQLAAMLCLLVFADNLLGRIDGNEETVWFWLSSGRGELMFVSGGLSVVCQLLFWSGIVYVRAIAGSLESRGPAPVGNSINVEHREGDDGFDEFFGRTRSSHFLDFEPTLSAR